MSVTLLDIRDATFGTPPCDVQELTLTSRGIVDVGSITQAPNLRVLNIAFNSLTSLAGLSTLTCLQSLNVSHNSIASLRPLAALPSLTSLNASHNRISSLSALSGCTGLRDLFVQANQVKSFDEVQRLAALPSLQRLMLASNPVCKAAPADESRLVALAVCPRLTVREGDGLLWRWVRG